VKVVGATSSEGFLVIVMTMTTTIVIIITAMPEAKKVKVKASHTRYPALGPELIPVHRQSACR